MDIRIQPSELSGKIEAIASKSVLHRILICSALSGEKSFVSTNAVSEDIIATLEVLSSFGAGSKIGDERIEIEPMKPILGQKVSADCHESGSTLRFLLPVAAALGINAVFGARGRLPLRPMDDLVEVLREHGATVSDSFPLEISGKIESGEYEISGEISSQFISGLLFALPLCDGDSVLKVNGTVQSQPYIDLTIDILEKFKIKIEKDGNEYFIKGNQKYTATNDIEVEGDWSNAAFWLAGGVRVTGLNLYSNQGDKRILGVFDDFGMTRRIQNGDVFVENGKAVGNEFDVSNIPDLVMIMAVIASTARGATKITNAGRLKFKESDRLKATAEMINNLGGCCRERSGSLIIYGNETLSGGEVDSYGDHRIVMAAAIAATKCKNSVIIRNAEAVNKSYPSFFRHFAELGGVYDVL